MRDSSVTVASRRDSLVAVRRLSSQALDNDGLSLRTGISPRQAVNQLAGQWGKFASCDERLA